MIEKIDLQLAKFENEQEMIKARGDILRGIKTPFWKWIIKLLEANEKELTDAVMEGRISPEFEEKAKAFVNISRMVRELPEKQLRELEVSEESEDKEEDFFGEEDSYEKTKKEI